MESMCSACLLEVLVCTILDMRFQLLKVGHGKPKGIGCGCASELYSRKSTVGKIISRAGPRVGGCFDSGS